MKFKLLQGKHCQKETVGKERDGTPKKELRFYKEGDVFESKHDLVALFNVGPSSRKFEYVEDDTPTSKGSPQPLIPQPPPPVNQVKGSDLDKLSIKELQQMAEEFDLDAKNAKSKEDYLKILKPVFGQ